MSKPLLEFKDVTKKYTIYQQQKTLFRLTKALIQRSSWTRDIEAVSHISYAVYPGDKLALIGLNGAGKTTLLRLAAGILMPSSGAVTCDEFAEPLFSYGLGMNESLSVYDNIFLLGAFRGISEAEIKEQMDEILEFSELTDFVYLPVRNLSAGQKQRLSFSVFRHIPEHFLAMDESFSVADLSFREKSAAHFDRLMDSEKTLIIATHDLSFVKQHCTRALWLEKGAVAKEGDPVEVANAYESFCQEKAGRNRRGRKP